MWNGINSMSLSSQLSHEYSQCGLTVAVIATFFQQFLYRSQWNLPSLTDGNISLHIIQTCRMGYFFTGGKWNEMKNKDLKPKCFNLFFKGDTWQERSVWFHIPITGALVKCQWRWCEHGERNKHTVKQIKRSNYSPTLYYYHHCGGQCRYPSQQDLKGS